MDIKKKINICKTLAKKSNHYRYKFGCFLYKKNRIISKGYNQLKTDPKSPHEFKMLHAEIHCILRSKEDIRGSTLFIYMEKPSGRTGNSKPCECCHALLKKVGVKGVEYTIDNNTIGYIIF